MDTGWKQWAWEFAGGSMGPDPATGGRWHRSAFVAAHTDGWYVRARHRLGEGKEADWAPPGQALPAGPFRDRAAALALARTWLALPPASGVRPG